MPWLCTETWPSTISLTSSNIDWSMIVASGSLPNTMKTLVGGRWRLPYHAKRCLLWWLVSSLRTSNWRSKWRNNLLRAGISLLAVNWKEKYALPKFCINLDYILEFIELDLLFGYIDFSAMLFISKHVGVTKGRPIVPGIADLILSCVEEVDACIFVSEARRWLTFVTRWVDDVWFCIVCFLSKRPIWNCIDENQEDCHVFMWGNNWNDKMCV